ncbi:MAG: ABC transporter ATP-binding protein [Oscillospiraceae bacterium]|nr:ABC transporter ATP-binding protein [Oscillospiraceae bacterium]
MNDEKKVSLRFFGIPLILPYLKPHKKILLGLVLTSLYMGLIDILLPLFQRYAIDHFIARDTLRGLGLFALAYAAVFASQLWANYRNSIDACQAEMYVGRDLKRECFNHLQTLSFSYFNHNSVGYIHARIMSDTERIASLVSWSLLDFIWSGIYVGGSIVAMLLINARLALWVLAAVPVMGLLSAFFQGRLLGLNRQVRETNSRITASFNEGITGAPTIKSLVVEEKMGGEFHALTGDMRRISIRTARTESLFRSTMVLTASVATALVLWKGGLLTREQLIQVGTLSAFMNYAQGMNHPIQSLIESVSRLITVQVNVERFHRLVTTRSDVQDSPEVVEKYGDSFHGKRENWEELRGDVEFEDVTFRYPDGEENVLEHFNLKVPAGSNVAIVGETGAGKSTLVNLVCRFFEPTSGRILIDGRDARERSQLWLHSHIGYVLQTPHLFSGTVLENLRYGKSDATMEEVERAVEAVHAGDIIARLPKGYDSEVGEGGNSLSTGEKQLLSFARAILADPAIFVLDEATSSVDTETERLIQDAIDKLMHGRTSFVIAHRLSTIRRADMILVVRDGRIVERGTHRELMAQRGEYWNLYTRQYREEQIKSSVDGAV